MPVLPRFAERYPNIGIVLDFSGTLVDLVAERIDVAVRLGRLPDSGLIAHRLLEMEYVACASPTYLSCHGTPARPEDLKAHSCLRFPIPGRGAMWRFRRGGEPPIAIDVRGRFALGNGIALRECAIAGMGIALLPRWNIEKQLEEGCLEPILQDYEATASEFGVAAWALYPSREYVPAKTRAFVECLKATFARTQDHGTSASEAR